ncbi:DUF4142 domain-containing protein [Sphaerisporangium fuscum]|uniref:DUF4142 domain-containing protein n=1 Tax=Sphaerisporangium fuscum TaxID=2835868 RepID=UPI001BDBC40C|nr:DUF4142 domain-containing protein [Sphaerisporangium fuscum]
MRRLTSVATVVGGLIALQLATACSKEPQPLADYGGPVPPAAPAEQLIGGIQKGLPPAQAPQAGSSPRNDAADATVQAAGADPATPVADPSTQASYPSQGSPADPAAQPSGGDPQAAAALRTTSTPFGPLSPADRDLLAKVRMAGLWEIPTGRQAAQRASLPVTRRNLGEIARQHTLLDAEVRQVAAKLRVPLPDEPNDDQKAWMAEISAKKGMDYDRTAVMRLRMAHGKIFPAIGAVRASTRNTVIRAFAEDCAKFVNTHMTLLEGTGLAGDMAMPPAPTVSAAPDAVPSGEPVPSAPPATSLLPHKM